MDHKTYWRLEFSGTEDIKVLYHEDGSDASVRTVYNMADERLNDNFQEYAYLGQPIEIFVEKIDKDDYMVAREEDDFDVF